MIIVAQMFGAIIGGVVLMINYKPKDFTHPGFAVAISAGLSAVIFGQIWLGLK